MNKCVILVVTLLAGAVACSSAPDDAQTSPSDSEQSLSTAVDKDNASIAPAYVQATVNIAGSARKGQCVELPPISPFLSKGQSVSVTDFCDHGQYVNGTQRWIKLAGYNYAWFPDGNLTVHGAIHNDGDCVSC